MVEKSMAPQNGLSRCVVDTLFFPQQERTACSGFVSGLYVVARISRIIGIEGLF
jgi:hypothetical protein